MITWPAIDRAGFRPTSFGVKATLFLGVVGIAYLATAYSNLFFMLLSFLLVLLILGSLWSWRSMAGIEARLLQPEPTPAGQGVPLVLELHGGPRPCSGLELLLWLDGDRAPRPIARHALLEADARDRIEARLEGLPRGIHRLQHARLRSAQPFGLWWRSVPIPSPMELVVYPTPTDDREFHRGGGLGDLLSAEREQVRASGLPVSLRGWRPGDSTSAIDWRATARRGQPVVKEFEQERGQELDIVFDRRCAAERFERCLGDLAAAALASRRGEFTLRLRSQDLDRRFGEQHSGIDELLRWLASAQRLASGSAPAGAGDPRAIQLPASLHGGAR